MKRRIEALALLALAGCASPPEANTVSTEELPLNLAWERENCPQFVGEISEHPEADARADFAAGKRSGVGASTHGSDMRPEMPIEFDTAACPRGRTGFMRYLKGLEGDVATCLDRAGMEYAERYNRELVRLCTSKH